MKRKIIIIFCITLCSGITAINLNFNRSVNKLNISLLNIEALASGESDSPTVNCPGGRTLCTTVNAPHGTFKYYKN
jgi:hypothetical protein